jgi:tetratricopeptide (TPR) repeat protein
MTDPQTVHRQQAAAAFDRGHLRESIEHYRKAIGCPPGDPSLHFWLALALSGVGDNSGAEAEYREAVRLGPTDAFMHHALGRHLLKTGQWERSVGSFRQAARLRPDWYNAMTGIVSALGRIAKRSNRVADFRSYLDAVEPMRSRYPDQLMWRQNRAWALWHLDRRLEAVAEMSELVSLEPSSRYFGRLLRYQHRLGQWRASGRTFLAWLRFELRIARRKQAWEESGAGETEAP